MGLGDTEGKVMGQIGGKNRTGLWGWPEGLGFESGFDEGAEGDDGRVVAIF